MAKFIYIVLLFLPFQGKGEVFPFKVIKGLIVTEAKIDGKDVLVILDTGAPGLVLNQKYYQPDQHRVIACTGINGSYECNSRQVKEWNWLGVQHKKTNAIVSDLSFLERALKRDIHALVGLAAITEDYISIDFDQQTISISKVPERFHPTTFSKFQYVNHLPVISCKVNGEKKILGLDTGAEYNYLFNFDQADDSRLMANASAIFVTGTDNVTDLKHRLPMNLEVSDDDYIYTSSFIVDITDEGFFKDASFDGLLGQSFLSQFNIVIHPGKQRILFTPRDQERSIVASP